MTYSMMSNPVEGVCDVILRRDGYSKIIVTTMDPLTDDQMRDLFWIVSMMSKNGVRLKDMFEKEKA